MKRSTVKKIALGVVLTSLGLGLAYAGTPAPPLVPVVDNRDPFQRSADEVWLADKGDD
jgi:hypothetical protein